ncbi:MAG TPA: ABC transporter substrate-binding protein [Syntrophorhabdaceae bacterium]|nr:ABC transporter substrate-binding protein [Syntrophorhabdaceae bacterium]
MKKRALVRSVLVLTLGLVWACFMPQLQTKGSAEPANTKAKATKPAAQKAKLTPRYGGVLRRHYDNDAQQLGDPAGRPFDLTSVKMSRPAIETLLRYDEKGNLVPWLLTGFKVGKDLHSVTLSVRGGVKFHDKTTCDAEAIRWNLERYRTSDNPELKAVTSIDVVNESMVRLNLSEWDSALIGNLASYAGMMISPTAFKANGADWCRTHPVGTGPFKFVSWQRDVGIKYEKFDSYWQKGKSYLDAIEWVIITDPVSRLAAFKRGEVDDLANVQPKDVEDLKATGKYYGAFCQLSALTFCLMGDSGHPRSPFANIKVRQAIEYAIDKQALAKSFTFGLGQIANQYAPPNSWGNNPNVKGYPYDPNKAKKLLAEAGYPRGFKTKIITPSIAFFSDPVVAIQGYLEKVGIIAEVEVVTPPKHTSVLRGGWENALIVHNAPLSEPDAAKNLSVNFSSRSYLKNTMLAPADYEQAITKALAAPDAKAKQKWVWDAQKMLIDKYALAGFYFTLPRISFISNKVHDTGVGATVDVQWTPEDAWIGE